jgi:hypothetical protein
MMMYIKQHLMQTRPVLHLEGANANCIKVSQQSSRVVGFRHRANPQRRHRMPTTTATVAREKKAKRQQA